ncbi:hypothetical protein [Desulfoplanes sp.]
MYVRTIIFPVLFVFVACSSLAQAQPIERIRVHSMGAKDTVEFVLTGESPPSLHSLTEEHPRLFFDLSSFKDPELPGTTPGTGMFVDKIRTAFHADRKEVRVVIDLVPHTQFVVEQKWFPNGHQFVIIISAPRQ